MGVVAAAIAGAAITAGAGMYTNSQNRKANDKSQALSKMDYQQLLDLAAKTAVEMQGEYEALTAQRPDVTWEAYVRNKIKAIDDPYLREVYADKKDEDFSRLREFAKLSSSDNGDNLMAIADKLSGGEGKFSEILAKRDNLVMNTDAAGRFARTYELAAPIRTGATTTKYDSKGNLVEGQRSDKQAFSIANEVQTEVEREQKTDLRSLEQDRISAATSQTEKARGFMQFYDPTGYASDMDDNRFSTELAFQSADEERAWSMYKMFAGQASGLTPTTPTYADPNAGNQLIASGIKSGVDAVGSYYADKKTTEKAARASSAATAQLTGYGATKTNPYST